MFEQYLFLLFLNTSIRTPIFKMFDPPLSPEKKRELNNSTREMLVDPLKRSMISNSAEILLSLIREIQARTDRLITNISENMEPFMDTHFCLGLAHLIVKLQKVFLVTCCLSVRSTCHILNFSFRSVAKLVAKHP